MKEQLEIEIPKQPATPPETKRMQDAVLARNTLTERVRDKLPKEPAWSERVEKVVTIAPDQTAAYFVIRGRGDYEAAQEVDAWLHACQLVHKLEREALEKMKRDAGNPHRARARN